MKTPPPLLFGPYRPPPRVKPADLLQTPEGRVRVDDLLATPLGPWPGSRRGGKGPGGKLLPILHGDLVKAIRRESAQAVAHWWGVSRWTVARWRRRLGVGRMTEGTRAVWRELAPTKMPQKKRRKKRSGRQKDYQTEK